MKKSYRQVQVLRLVRSLEIHTQEELARALEDVGIVATQGTLSRDIRELNLVKTAQGYRQMGPDSPGPGFPAIARGFILDVRTAQNQVVLKTTPATANSVAAALDREDWQEVVGTVAGDDTVLVVAPDRKAAVRVRDRIFGLLR